MCCWMLVFCFIIFIRIYILCSGLNFFFQEVGNPGLVHSVFKNACSFQWEMFELPLSDLSVELLPYVINQQLKSSTHVTKMFKQVPWNVKGTQLKWCLFQHFISCLNNVGIWAYTMLHLRSVQDLEYWKAM